MANSSTRESPFATFPLPDLAIHQILQSLPTKAAVRMSCLSKQRQGLWSLSPFIDFVERHVEIDDDTDLVDRHRKFTNILKRCMEYREKQVEPKHDALRKFRLRMASYVSGGEDAAMVDKWLTFAFERRVKKLDISLRTSKPSLYHCLSQATFVNAKLLTRMNLEHVRMNISDNFVKRPKDLPCLKTMSLKDVHFDLESLFNLMNSCRSIEYLSLNSCSFEEISEKKPVEILSRSLKTLRFIDCSVGELKILLVSNLESFTFVTAKSVGVRSILLDDLDKLKHVDIRARQLKSISFLGGCHENLEAVLDTPNLDVFRTPSYLKSKFHVKASSKRISVDILLWELWSGAIPSDSDGHGEHFKAVTNFFKQFSCARKLTLAVPPNYPAFIFPENLRKAYPSASPIFPNLAELRLEVCDTRGDLNISYYHLDRVKRHPHLRPKKVTRFSDLSKFAEIKPDLSNPWIWLAPWLKKVTVCAYGNATAASFWS